MECDMAYIDLNKIDYSDFINKIRSEKLMTSSLFVDDLLGYSPNKIIKDEESNELIIFTQRALLIYHSAVGERNVYHRGNYDIYKVSEQMIFPESNDVYFFIKEMDYAIRELVLCIQDVYFNIPTHVLPSGLGIIPQFKDSPKTEYGVENVEGEISDFIADYIDKYGTVDEFIPSF